MKLYLALLLLSLILSECNPIGGTATPTPTLGVKAFQPANNVVTVAPTFTVTPTKTKTLAATSTNTVTFTLTLSPSPIFTATKTTTPTRTMAPTIKVQPTLAIQPTSPPQPTARPQPTSPPQPTAAQSGNCDPSYPTVCIAPPPPDKDCKDVPYKRLKYCSPILTILILIETELDVNRERRIFMLMNITIYELPFLIAFHVH